MGELQNGGRRPGAGRPPGRQNRATLAQKGTLEALARSYGPAALRALADIAANSESPAARVAAATAILDRGYGKPRQAADLKPEHPGDATKLINGAPVYAPMLAPFIRPGAP